MCGGAANTPQCTSSNSVSTTSSRKGNHSVSFVSGLNRLTREVLAGTETDTDAGTRPAFRQPVGEGPCALSLAPRTWPGGGVARLGVVLEGSTVTGTEMG